MSIKTRLLIFALSISLVPIFIITMLYYFDARSTIERQTLNWLTAIAESKNVHILSFLDSKKGRVVDFSFDGFIRDSLEAIPYGGDQNYDYQSYVVSDLNRHLKVNKKPLDRHIMAIAVLDINGNVVASTNELWIGKDMSKAKIFMSCVSKNYGETYTGKSYNIPYLNESCIFISAPLISKLENKAIGVIINAYDIAILDEITTKRAGIGESGEVYIVNRDKKMITESRFIENAIFNQVVDTEPVRRIIDDDNGGMRGIYPNYRGVSIVGASVDMPEYGWILLAEVDKAQTFASIMKLRIYTIIIGVVSAIVVITIAILVSKRVTKPIQKLVEGTRKIASGNLGFKIPTRSKDEIGLLATSFNDMTSQLGESKRQVEDYAQNLEQKVEDKTKEIAKEKEYTENLIDTAQDAIISIDGKGIIGVWNKSAEKIFGYSKDEIIGQPVATIIPERYRDQHENGIRQFLKTGEARIIGSTVEVSGITKEGLEVPIEMSLAFQKDEEGRYSFMAIIRDITERNTREEEIQKLSHAIEQSPVSIVITDTEGNIEYVNRKFVEVTGYTSEEVIGKNPRVLKSDETTSEEYKDLWETITSGNEWHGEFSNKNKEGEIYYEAASISPVMNRDGKISHFIAVKEDITERKRAEEALKRAKNEAEAANIAKSEFLASMSHEIRTPMNGVIGMTNLLIDTELNREQREYANTVSESANSLLAIINDILDFSKIEAGKLEMENIDFDLRVTVESIIDIFAVKVEKGGLEFSCFVDPEIPSLLRGDPGRVRQVMINLVNNAMKFTKDGEVALSVSLVRETESQVTVRFDVKDTGIGIHADHMNRLFKSFSQVDVSTTRKYGGTGLGLVISKQITELMGGQIGVESEEGKGSTFWFTAVLEKQPLDQQQAPKKLGDIENMRVLVVDDNGTNRYIFRKYLESWHCRVEEAGSAGEAMKKLREAVNGKDPFKIALLDYCMPEVDGESLSKEIKADPQLKDLILVMLTSVVKRGDAEHFKGLGFAAYLHKPIKQSLLLDCLRIVMGESASVEKDTVGQIVTQYSISEDRKQRVRILLAEDNVVNQKVALRILEKKLGYHTDVVTNGKEAVESLEKFDYDLVLMDCQMPEVDGYEATSTIRDETSSVRNHSIPIIAMTANAMKGDREKCLEAGMDDYITKPINVPKLADAIERNLCDEDKQQAQSVSTSIVSISKESKEHIYAS